MIVKEKRSTAPNATELKWAEVIADLGNKSEDKSFTAFGDSRYNRGKGGRKVSATLSGTLFLKGRRDVLVVGNRGVGAVICWKT